LFIQAWDTTNLPLANILFELKAGTWQAEANAPGTGAFDNFLAAVSASAAAPTLSGISPASGPTTGNTSVSITGTGFASGATVTIGGSPATQITVTSSTTITATSPAHSAGAADVTVSNPGGQAGTLTGGFTYVAPPPPSVA